MKKTVKRRRCPALSKEISGADCRDHRCSHYHCPADCRYNPFSTDNYLALLKLEHQLASRWLPWLMKDAADPKALQQELELVVKADSAHGLHRFMLWNLLFKRDAAGLTSAQRWEKAGFPGLKNDERVLMRCQMRTRVALLEVHRIMDLCQVEVVDLFSPGQETIKIMDRALAAGMARFAPYLAWTFPLPHFWRLSGSAILLPDLTPIDSVEGVQTLVAHGGGPAEKASVPLWLAEHFEQFADALEATALARRKRLFESSDVQIGKAIYELRAPFPKCRAQLEALEEVHPSPLAPEEAREGAVAAGLWFDTRKAANENLPVEGASVLGRIVLGPSHWRLEAIGASRLTELRTLFEASLGDRVRFQGERRDDLARQILQHDPEFDPALVPPRLLENIGAVVVGSSISAAMPAGITTKEAITQLVVARQKASLRRAIPLLEGKTPLEAARIPKLRPKLIQLMKSRIRRHDETNAQTDGNDDLDWALRELGLEELIFPPPPPRPARELPEAADSPNPSRRRKLPRPPAPLLPLEPLTMRETVERLDALLDRYEDFESAKAELAASGATAVRDMETILSGLLNQSELSFLRPFLVQGWFVVVAPGYEPPEVEFQSLLDAFDDAAIAIHEALSSSSPAALNAFIQTLSQPGIADVILKAMLSAVVEAPKKSRPRAKATPAMIAAVVAIIEEADCCLRGGADDRETE